ncbi:MAG: ATP synthase F1 subunit delta [Eubacterium sp.]|nr:ATP synthase F1 subunit delta [Eubacterium sp.]SEF65150.1 F-type H+-transporting ATPase subunit delta [Eubacterium ruminantium]
MAREVESVYGLALFEAAKEEGRLEEHYEEAEAIVKIISANPDFKKVLVHPDIKVEEKLQIIDNAFGGKADEIFSRTMKLAVTKGHSAYIEKILRVFIDRVMEELKIGKADVSSAVPLTEEQKDKVMKKLLQTTGYKKINIHYIVDKTLIGGVIIKIGDRVVDSSVKTSLETMRKSIL